MDDLDKGTIMFDIRRTNGEGRLVFSAAEALSSLRQWRGANQRRPEHDRDMIVARVFHCDGEAVEHFPCKAWKAACRRGCNPPDARPTPSAARWLDYRRPGEAEDVIMAKVGWKTRSMLERYNIVAEDDLRRGRREHHRLKRDQNGPNGEIRATDSTKEGVTN